jgi:signal transduction histidine kinase
MQRIITELRELSMFDPQDVERGQRPILLSDLIWQLAAQWKPIATGADIWLAIHTTSEQDYILGDERRLYWAIGNLIDNAIKYSLPGATVTLDGEVNAEGTLAHILVSDAGVGILPEDLPHVFERFFRGKPTRPDGSIITPPGTGQGLHLAQRVIEAHGGEIVIESGPGIGTQAHVWLPLTASVALELPSPNSEDATAPLPASDASAEENSVRVQKQGPHQPEA